MRCRECSRPNRDPLTQGSPCQYLLGAMCALLSAVLLGWLSQVLIFWLGSLYGYTVGEATLRGGGRKRGLGMQVIAGGAAAIGAAIWATGFGDLPLTVFFNPWQMAGLGLGVFFAVTRVRYF
jgi:hypothetical protein